MAERVGFEPTEGLHLHLISSQARSTGLRHLSAWPRCAPGALANALCDALTPFNVEITSLPLKPEMILEKINAGRERA